MSKQHYDSDSAFSRIAKYLRLSKSKNKKTRIANLEKAENTLMELDRERGHFEETVIDKARVKKAAKLYYQGLSLRRAAELTGADPASLMSYIGVSRMHDIKESGALGRRITIARGIFER